MVKESRNTVVSILTSSTKWGPRNEVRLTKFCSGPALQRGDGITIYPDMCEGLGSISRTFKTLRNLFSQYFFSSLACRCATEAKRQNLQWFALQYYGECWGSSESLKELFPRCIIAFYSTCMIRWKVGIFDFSIRNCLINKQKGVQCKVTKSVG